MTSNPQYFNFRELLLAGVLIIIFTATYSFIGKELLSGVARQDESLALFTLLFTCMYAQFANIIGNLTFQSIFVQAGFPIVSALLGIGGTWFLYLA